MSDKTTLLIITIYVLFLAFIHVKIGGWIVKYVLKRKYSNFSNRGIGGFTICLILLFPIRYLKVEFMALFFVMYAGLGMIWGIIYFDYIYKDRDKF